MLWEQRKYELGDFKVIQYQSQNYIENCKEKYHWYLGSERVDVHICEKEMPGDDNEQVSSTQNVAF